MLHKSTAESQPYMYHCPTPSVTIGKIHLYMLTVNRSEAVVLNIFKTSVGYARH